MYLETVYRQCEIDKDEEDETCRPTSRSLSLYHKKKRRELQAFLGKIILVNLLRIVHRKMDLWRLLFRETPDASHGSHKEIAERADKRDFIRIKVVTMISA